VIPFTDREMRNAWRQNLAASQVEPRTNVHRLLLFYAVECGLKAVIMETELLTRTDEKCRSGQVISDFGHNINGLLDYLSIGSKTPRVRLKNTKIKPIKKHKTSKYKEERTVSPQDINQMWRYGGKSVDVSDEKIEQKLLEINQWIEEKLL